jgi:hypothetical protein
MSGIFLDIDCLLCQAARAVGIFAIILIEDKRDLEHTS